MLLLLLCFLVRIVDGVVQSTFFVVLRDDTDHGIANQVENFVHGRFRESGQGRNERHCFFHERIRGDQIHERSDFGPVQFQLVTIVRLFAKCLQRTIIVCVKEWRGNVSSESCCKEQ